MVECENCREISEKPKLRLNYDEGDFCPVCRYCGSENIRLGEDTCDTCGRVLFSGELAYETKKQLFCTDCIREVII